MVVTQRTEISGGGVGFLGLLTIILVVLKAMGYITLSWWWVWAPIWVPIAIVAVGFMLWFLAALLFATYRENKATAARNKRYGR